MSIWDVGGHGKYVLGMRVVDKAMLAETQDQEEAQARKNHSFMKSLMLDDQPTSDTHDSLGVSNADMVDDMGNAIRMNTLYTEDEEADAATTIARRETSLSIHLSSLRSICVMGTVVLKHQTTIELQR